MNIAHQPVVLATSIGPPSGTVDVEAEFHRLAKSWRRQAAYSSASNLVFEHPAYRSIVALGRTVIPLLLQQVEQRQGWWFDALEELTGANPVCEEDAGDFDRTAAAWVQWGRREGFIS